ncbi:CCA tRNA nucleotidyltransferase [Bdellovibrio svalbardensis]|uniref:CCA tRNA nucleotidyltransferase n=1 Tax=Bdellovibrio svalbardensis TaxID=2972972 RepID=A0ABT6DNL7_9BACT|nr:CCA tRNA nucleotidyltransferase [Bdellovibrio svalbardensis]MDG0818229.1 CCA tRNA nucleotidyltransferase [Bdellovibrio svalbardensis]
MSSAQSVRQLIHAHPHWGAVQAIYHRLVANGYCAFLAGGCVRDALLGLVAHDLDIATDATPDQIESLFEKTVNVGKSFGVMRVIVDGADIEVATFRTDGDYKDGRRPDSVVFSSPEEDAKRRDFTINALFFDLQSEQVLDFVDGQIDLEQKIIKTVGQARFRFQEDQLRLLRAARFAAQLSFAVEEQTLLAMTEMASAVKNVSGERIRDEMGKLLKSKNVSLGLEVMNQSGLMKVLFPWRQGKTDWSAMGAQELWQNLSLFFREASPPDLAKGLGLLRLSAKDRKAIEESWELWQQPEAFFTKRTGSKLQLLLKSGVDWALQVLLQEKKFVPEIEAVRKQKAAWGDSLPKAFLSGDDVKGLLQGEAIGRCLQEVYWLQLERQLGSREEALLWLKKHLEKGS